MDYYLRVPAQHDQPEIHAAIAMHRFGLGSNADDAVSSSQGPMAWLMNQLGVQHAKRDQLPSSKDLFRITQDFKRLPRREREQARPEFNTQRRTGLQRLAIDRAQQAILGIAPFLERLCHFWANHFAVSAAKSGLHFAALSRENEVIRPHIRSSFAQLLVEFVRHPSTLIFLDNEGSLGPGSAAARSTSAAPVNENLAREILELHSLGVGGGYTQRDVIELAKSLTGWSVGGLLLEDDPQTAGSFVFRPEFHEPGNRKVLGKSYPDTGVSQATDILIDLALHPSTARHIARKLCQYFVSDKPPQEMVGSLTTAFLDTQGDLNAVYSHLIGLDAAWSAPLTKYKTPEEYCYSALRTLEVRELDAVELIAFLRLMGQPLGTPPSPKGWSSQREDYRGGATFLRRMELAWRLAEANGASHNPLELYQRAFAGVADPRVEKAIGGAESTKQGLALFLLSPQFLQR